MVRALVQSVQEKITELLPKQAMDNPPFRNRRLPFPPNAALLASVVGATLMPLTVEERQQILEAPDLEKRLRLALDFLQRETQAKRMSSQISESIQRSRDQEMKLATLQRQAQEIQQQLQRLQQKKDKHSDSEEGSEDEDEVARLSERLAKAQLPEEAEKLAKKELKRLKSLQAHHPEYSSVHSYLELLAGLPWQTCTEDNFDLQEARRVLDDDHRGLEKVKVRILEFLAVQKMRGKPTDAPEGRIAMDIRAKWLQEVSAGTRPPGLIFGPRQQVAKALRELEAHGFGRSRPVMDMGCAYHDFSQGLLRVSLDLQQFPEVLALIEESMKSMCRPHPGPEGLNVIARHYEGTAEKDRLAFHADNFVVGPWVFGCILRQEGSPEMALHFRELIGEGSFRMKEQPGHLYLQTGEAREFWSHGIPDGGTGLRQSLTWRWLRPSFLRWCSLEQGHRKQQALWLQRFVSASRQAKVEQEAGRNGFGAERGSFKSRIYQGRLLAKACPTWSSSNHLRLKGGDVAVAKFHPTQRAGYDSFPAPASLKLLTELGYEVGDFCDLAAGLVHTAQRGRARQSTTLTSHVSNGDKKSRVREASGESAAPAGEELLPWRFSGAWDWAEQSFEEPKATGFPRPPSGSTACRKIFLSSAKIGAMAPGLQRSSSREELEDASPKGPQNAVADAVLYPQRQMTTSQLEAALAEQQRELHMLVAHHYETARQMLVTRDQMAMACQIENQELRAQIGELRKQTNTSARRHREQQLLARQHVQANKVLLKRDLEARSTEAENAELRARLARMKNRSDDEATEQCESEDGSPMSKMTAARTAKSSERMPDFAVQQSPPRPSSSHSKGVNAPSATGVNLLMQLKLPGQVYDEGNFFPQEESSDDGDVDLPAWDEELEKRPKRAIAVMDMKERMRQMFKAGQVKPTVYYKEGGWCSRIAGHNNFETVVYGFIVANVIWLGIDAVVNQEDLLVNAEAYVIAIENVFCVFFTGELLIRLGAYRTLWDAVKDPWMGIDALLVLGMLLETWIFYVILHFADVDFSLVDQSSLRLLRVLRVSRVARIVRILRALPELLILVKALGVATRSVFFTFCLLALVIYLFALACTTIGKDTSSGGMYFANLGQSMFTLFFNGIFGFDLPKIATAVFADNVPLGIVFCLYLVFAPLTMMNLLVAVLVEVVGVLATAEQEMVNSQYEHEQMEFACRQLDENSDESISMDEFAKLLDKRQALLAMRGLGIDVLAMMETPELIFGKAGKLTFQDFIEIILALRDTNTATVRDINSLARRIIAEIQGTVGQLNSKKEKNGSKDKDKVLTIKSFRSTPAPKR
ncbi:unnamed protein product [Effrenium voratum]|uniref:Uncharacterized protein n=1 Tax=Effrenium voratum TaxID=2562239 RepID=A0AA36JMK7_9DINO|nr:unnamed protein product [Effrenium voratum]